ncbi:ALG13 UDP-N-acetylglucosamine transferase subunit ALG13 [Candida maltosa Xu316]
MGKSVLVTTGATVTFKSLIQTILTPDFINQLISLGVTELTFQYGNEIKKSKHISKSVFEDQIAILSKSMDFTSSHNSEDNTVVYKHKGFEILAFPYSSNIDEYITIADIVISHAGTGSIIDVLKQQKKLIVVVNEKLMDNHQLEIANEFSDLKYCLSFANTKALTYDSFWNGFASLLNDEIKLETLPETDGSIVETIICEELDIY